MFITVIVALSRENINATAGSGARTLVNFGTGWQRHSHRMSTKDDLIATLNKEAVALRAAAAETPSVAPGPGHYPLGSSGGLNTTECPA